MLLLIFVGAPTAGKSEDWPPVEDLPPWIYDEPRKPPDHYHDDDEALILLNP